MNDADTILSTVAAKILGGDITEDDALEILENNLRLLTELDDVNIKDKYDALTVVYKMTNSIYFEEYVDWKLIQTNLDQTFKFVMNRKKSLIRNRLRKKNPKD